MILNPFKIAISRNNWIFYDDSNGMCLKIFEMNDSISTSDFISWLEIIARNFDDLHFVLDFNYENSHKKVFFSFNIMKSDYKSLNNFLSKNMDSGKYLSYIEDVKLKKAYYSLFNGIENGNFRMKSERVKIIEAGKNVDLLNLAFFKVNLHNFNRFFDDSFEIIQDLVKKLGLNLEIMFFLKSKNQKLRMESYLIYKEERDIIFYDTLNKLRDIKNFQIFIEKIKLNKKLLASFILRRSFTENMELLKGFAPIMEKFLYIDKKDKKFIQNILKENDNIFLEGDLNFKEVPKKTLTKFHALKNEFNGIYIDLKHQVIETKEKIILLIFGLNFKVFFLLLEKYGDKKIFRLMFVEAKELIEFKKHFPNCIENISLEEGFSG